MSSSNKLRLSDLPPMPQSAGELPQMPAPDKFAEWNASRHIAPNPVGDPTSLGSALTEGGLSGLTQGFSDEAQGAGAAAMTDGDRMKAYLQARDAGRADEDKARAAHPWAFTGAKVAGSLLNPLARAGVSGLTALGAIQGLGNSSADLTQGDVGGALKDSAIGGATGLAAGLGGKAIAAGLQPMAGSASDVVEAAVENAPKEVEGLSTLPEGLSRMSSAVSDAAPEVAEEAPKLAEAAPEVAEQSGNPVFDFIKNHKWEGIGAGLGHTAGRMTGIPGAGSLGTLAGGLAGRTLGGAIERTATATPDIIQKLTSNGGERFVGAIKQAMQNGSGSVAATVFILQQTEPEFNKAMQNGQ